MKSIIAAGLAGLAMGAAPTHTELTADYSYAQWLADFAPRHQGTEEAFRSNLARILAHNADSSQTWKAGVNQWTGLTRSEFGKIIRGYRKEKRGLATGGGMHDTSKDVPVGALPTR